MVSINWIPVSVGITCFLFRFIYFLRNKVSIILARVEGRPIPFSFIISRSSSSSTCLPAVSIARSSEASVNWFGGLVCFSRNEGSCGPFSPFINVGNIPDSLGEEFGVSKTTRQPFSKISFPVVLNFTFSALPITVVLATLQSG